MRALWIGLAALTLTLGCATAPPSTTPELSSAAVIIGGDAPEITASGLTPGDTATIHALRRTVSGAFTNNQWVETPVQTHAFATFTVPASGVIAADALLPVEASYEGIDINGLLWSGYPIGAPELADQLSTDAVGPWPETPETLVVALEVDGAVVARREVPLRSYDDTIAFTTATVAENGVSGVFAAPAGAQGLPTLVLLHGSEGADPAASRRWAGRMAQRGFAAFALQYVAYSWSGGIEGVPDTFINIPIEQIAQTRAYLATRPEADVERFGILGVSKGAEFSLVAASRYDWIDAVVACVPSDMVWSGFGREAAPGEQVSSWSWGGTPLPYIPYLSYEDVFAGRATATQVHNRSRAALSPEALAAARIPVEDITARVLLIGGGQDEVWDSFTMAASVEASMVAAGFGDRVEAMLFPEAGHGICGTGASLQRPDGTPNPQAHATANSQSFQRTVAFFREALN